MVAGKSALLVHCQPAEGGGLIRANLVTRSWSCSATESAPTVSCNKIINFNIYIHRAFVMCVHCCLHSTDCLYSVSGPRLLLVNNEYNIVTVYSLECGGGMGAEP